MSQFYISAAHKSSGKTTISIGLSHALSQMHSVQMFKKGPDYIDPMWLQQASGQPVYNLDFYTSSTDYILQQYEYYKSLSEISIVEGNKGLYDGMNVDGSDSNAAMAKLLNTPVILVLDTQGITRGIAPLINGYNAFDKQLTFAGIILNKVAGNRHESKLIDAIEAYCDIPIIGSVHRNKSFEIEERHLGLIPNTELKENALKYIKGLKDVIKESVNLDIFTKSLHTPKKSPIIANSTNLGITIAIAKDASFGFYYADDIAYFNKCGVHLVEFNTLNDTKLPDNIDALFIGGGFPETHLSPLSKNTLLKKDIYQKITNGLPTYAECGGLMYLCEDIEYNNKTEKMVGVIPGSIKMHAKPQGRGYIKIQPTKDHLWNIQDSVISGHEFHYSSLKPNLIDTIYGYSMKRGTGINHQNDGIIMYNLIANYCHLRQTDQCHWIDNFIEFIKHTKAQSNYDRNY
ncbi:MAG: cobyrinate a,c-diamide synthase [Gammaproteobacteria bacterium]|nr:cobyrinate a,c-diamide synthase [Gammaproteobacteria bacterium]